MTLKEYCNKKIEEYQPYAEEGLTMDEIKLLAKRDLDWLFKCVDATNQTIPELIVRMNNILMYLAAKNLIKEFFPELNLEITEDKLFVTWKVWLDKYMVGVDFKNGNITLSTHELTLDEVINPVKYKHLKQFDL